MIYSKYSVFSYSFYQFPIFSTGLDTSVCCAYSTVNPICQGPNNRFTIDEDQGIFIVDLGRAFIMNTILIELSWKGDVNAFSYQLCVGMQNTNAAHWQMIADYSKFDCRGVQKVYMEDTVIRWDWNLKICWKFRISDWKAIHIDSFKCTKSKKIDFSSSFSVF